jgi:hypothetical protein
LQVLGFGSAVVQLGLFMKYGFHQKHTPQEVADKKLEEKLAERKQEPKTKSE